MGALKGCVVAADRREDGGRQEGKEGERGREGATRVAWQYWVRAN